MTLTLVAAASVAYSVFQTSTTPTTACFSTLTLAWEFLAGALLAAIRVSSRRHRVLPWVGVAAILGGCLAFAAGTTFPGYAAALPVAAAALALWSGAGSALAHLGRVAPVALLGSVSYAAYLWHWPLLTLLPEATHDGRQAVRDRADHRAGLAVHPLRGAHPLRSPAARRPSDPDGRDLVRRHDVRRGRSGARCGPLPGGRRRAEPAAGAVRPQQHDRLPWGASDGPGPRALCRPGPRRVLLPDPAAVKKDDDNLLACWGSDADGQPRVCPLGPVTGFTKHLLAIGDSHSNTLIGAHRRIAAQRNWRIDVAGTGGCYVTDSPRRQPSFRPRRSLREVEVRTAGDGPRHTPGCRLRDPLPSRPPRHRRQRRNDAVGHLGRARRRLALAARRADRRHHRHPRRDARHDGVCHPRGQTGGDCVRPSPGPGDAWGGRSGGGSGAGAEGASGRPREALLHGDGVPAGDRPRHGLARPVSPVGNLRCEPGALPRTRGRDGTRVVTPPSPGPRDRPRRIRAPAGAEPPA